MHDHVLRNKAGTADNGCYVKFITKKLELCYKSIMRPAARRSHCFQSNHPQRALKNSLRSGLPQGANAR